MKTFSQQTHNAKQNRVTPAIKMCISHQFRNEHQFLSIVDFWFAMPCSLARVASIFTIRFTETLVSRLQVYITSQSSSHNRHLHHRENLTTLFAYSTKTVVSLTTIIKPDTVSVSMLSTKWGSSTLKGSETPSWFRTKYDAVISSLHIRGNSNGVTQFNSFILAESVFTLSKAGNSEMRS